MRKTRSMKKMTAMPYIVESIGIRGLRRLAALFIAFFISSLANNSYFFCKDTDNSAIFTTFATKVVLIA
jgi:hypothetical protein